VGGSYAAAATALPPMLPPATYNAANQLTRWGGTVQSYDANGNLINDGVNLYMWDARNQLASITGLANANFQHDPSGRRAIKTVSGVTTAFLYDGPNIVQELSGSTPTANLLSPEGWMKCSSARILGVLVAF